MVAKLRKCYGKVPEVNEAGSEIMKKLRWLTSHIVTRLRSEKSIILPMVLATLLMLPALLEGCIQENFQEKPTAEDILNRMQDKYDSISSYKTMLYQKEIADGKERETLYEVSVKMPGKVRIEHISSGVVTILNGSKVWFYNKNTGEIKGFPYHQKSSFLDFFGFTLEMLKEYNASLSGEETVNGKDCYVISLEPVSEAVSGQSKPQKSEPLLEKLWVVKGEWYPARVQMGFQLPEEMKEKFGLNFSNSTVIFELRNVEFNISISDAEFLPPARKLNLSALSDEEVVGLALNSSELEIYRGWNCTIREKKMVGDSLYIDMYFGRNNWKNAVHVSFYVKQDGSISDVRIYPYVKTSIPVGLKGVEREGVLGKALNDSRVKRIIAGRDYYIWQVSGFMNPITGEKYDEYSVYLRINSTNETYVIYLSNGLINVRNATCPGKTGWWC